MPAGEAAAPSGLRVAAERGADALILDSVFKSYPTRQGMKHVFQGLSAVIPPRRRVGILGRNGAGKSTLLNLISGAVRPDFGTIVRPGGSMSWPIGLFTVSQGQLTAVDNIKFVARLYGVDWRDVLEYVADFSELGRDLWNPVSTYSAGMRQKFNIGLALAVEFDWYLIDEALSVADARFRDRARAALEARYGQVSMLFVSHSASTIRQNCDMAALLVQGRLYFFDDVNQALRAYDQTG